MAGAGVALAILYAVVALATGALSSRPVRPLFDGFAPPVPYNWVNPPPERSGDNTVPEPVEREFALGAEGVEATNASSDDAQVIVGLDKESVPAMPPDIAVKVRLDPFDAGTLGPLPPGLRPAGNAYRVTVGYVPSGTEIPRLSRKGTIALTAAEPADTLLFSPDGSVWEERPIQPYGQDNGVFTELEAPGYFLAATSATSLPGRGTDHDTSRKVVLLGIAAAVPIAGAILVLRLPSPIPAGTKGGRRPTSTARPRPAARKPAGKGRKKSGQRRKR